MSGEGLLSGGHSAPSLTGHSVTSPGSDSQESSWIGLLSLVSRPALSFLQNRVPGRAQASALCHSRMGLIGGGVDGESESLRPLDDVMPQHAAHRQSSLPGPHGGQVAPWLTAGSLRELGIQSAEELALNHQGQPGSPSRTLLNHFWLSSWKSQEVQPPEQTDWGVVAPPVKISGGTSGMRWDDLWRAKESSERALFSDLSQDKEGTLTGRLCDGPAVVVQSGGRGGTLAGTAGLSDHKEQLGQLKLLRGSESSSSPDQDHGYSSLEEEQLLVRALRGQQGVRAGLGEEPSTSQQVDEEEETQKECCVGPAEALVSDTPQCRNKAIAFIMGGPCSDDDGSQSGESSDDGDDGFDSEDSSDLTDSTDEDDDEGSDSEADPEVERLWSSLCQSVDPYNPRNFTARLHTSTRPRPAPTSPPSSRCSPASSPSPAAHPLSSPFNQEVWEDSSTSDVDEAENLRLWSSFTCSADPYNPRNFKASLRTQGSTVAGTWVKDKKAPHIPLCSSNHDPSPPPEHRRDSSCSGQTTSSRTQSCRSTKKVRFRDHVDEFFISCGEEEEDRKGPWEELARDRFRFLRRCQEVEQSLAYCLQPEHRRLVRRRLAALWVQDQ